jgi:hypothetical protein
VLLNFFSLELGRWRSSEVVVESRALGFGGRGERMKLGSSEQMPGLALDSPARPYSVAQKSVLGPLKNVSRGRGKLRF